MKTHTHNAVFIIFTRISNNKIIIIVIIIIIKLNINDFYNFILIYFIVNFLI